MWCKPWIPVPERHKWDICIVFLQFQHWRGQCWLHKELEASLGYMDPVQKKRKQITSTWNLHFLRLVQAMCVRALTRFRGWIGLLGLSRWSHSLLKLTGNAQRKPETSCCANKAPWGGKLWQTRETEDSCSSSLLSSSSSASFSWDRQSSCLSLQSWITGVISHGCFLFHL